MRSEAIRVGELARRTVTRSFEPKDGKLGGAKLPLAARAGHTVRLRVAPGEEAP